jgi:hypothetical protein
MGVPWGFPHSSTYNSCTSETLSLKELNGSIGANNPMVDSVCSSRENFSIPHTMPVDPSVSIKLNQKLSDKDREFYEKYGRLPPQKKPLNQRIKVGNG